jgi:UDP-N-acetylmuramoyl-tripeptide--D-alanyl-D-alanine ligase
MINSTISLSDVLNATGGKLLSSLNTTYKSVGTDTRKDLSGQLFVALKGDAHDAHAYLDQAVASGASALLVQEWNERFHPLQKQVTVVLVNDTLQALQNLGQFRRRQWGRPVIAITGSNGKTTTKEFLAQILSVYKVTHYNQGSFNNHWGLPLTLLELQPQHEVAICEMGMNHLGEIASLVQLAEPNIAGVTMVGRAHLEGLGSIENIARAKAEILTTPNPSLQTGIFNLDNPWTKKMYDVFKASGKKGLTFSSEIPQTDVHLSIQKMDFNHIELSGVIAGVSGKVTVPIFGKQNLTNLMFAACAALAAGLSAEQIWKGLPLCKTVWGRNQKMQHPSGSEILFDGYNANPDSQKALIENLQLLQLTTPLIGVFGEMRELGDHAQALHEELGALAAKAPFQRVFFVGNNGESFRTGFEKTTKKAILSIHNDVNDELVLALKNLLPQKPVISIKGSRGVRLERILKSLDLLNEQDKS